MRAQHRVYDGDARVSNGGERLPARHSGKFRDEIADSAFARARELYENANSLKGFSSPEGR